MNATPDSMDQLLLPYQSAFAANTARFKIGLWARQTGKDHTAAASPLGVPPLAVPHPTEPHPSSPTNMKTFTNHISPIRPLGRIASLATVGAMELTRTAYGIWSGGRFMHFGEPLDDERFLGVIRYAYDRGIRTFMTADVYGNGQGDEMVALGLAGVPRDSYCLVGAVGHDFYEGKREGAKGYPRFTNPALRGPDKYADYLRFATEKSLARSRTSKFDLLLLHNPDSTGYSNDAVWKGMEKLKEAGLTDRLGIAPGPANGFTLDLIHAFEKFGGLIDWAMLILNPLEPWPGQLSLPAAEKHNVKVITRVVDYGGLFHDDVKPGHTFRQQDHRVFRPAGWVEAGRQKMEQMRSLAEKHGLTMLQLACLWNLSQPPVHSVIPTLIQEAGPDAKPIKKKVDELAALGIDARLSKLKLTTDEREQLAQIGNNKGCMNLKGASPSHTGEAEADHWSLRPELIEVGRRWGIDPLRDLGYTHEVQKSAA